MVKSMTGLALLVLFLCGCGTENPFDRGPDFDDGTTAPESGGAVSFSVNIQPILAACTGCHAGGTGGWTYDGGANAYAQTLSVVDTDTPESSLLLVKASGGDGHGGGVFFSQTSADYQSVLAWIRDGAPDN